MKHLKGFVDLLCVCVCVFGDWMKEILAGIYFMASISQLVQSIPEVCTKVMKRLVDNV